VTEQKVFCTVPSIDIYLRNTVDVPGILYVVAFKVEFNADTPVVNVWFVPAVFVIHATTSLPASKFDSVTTKPVDV
jgi:hypothetical protein